MSEQTPQQTPAAPVDLQTQRATLMQDADWRARAMNPQSTEWAQLLALDEQIANAPPPTEEAQPAFVAPEQPDGYEFLPQPGVEMDEAAALELKAGLHSAGVDADLAGLGYQLAALTETTPLTAEALHQQGEATERALLSEWGARYDDKLAAANAEGKRLFDKLPASIRGDMSYREFVVAYGLANSATFIKALAARAATRKAH